MVAAVPDMPVQLGGGVRSPEIAQAYFAAGVQRVIVGTRAIEEPQFLRELAAAHPDRVLLGLDARDGLLATAGWDETAQLSAETFLSQLSGVPIAGVVYTDINRDGMLQGLNVTATVQLSAQTARPVIASGGLHTLDDLRALADAAAAQPDAQIIGAITGRAIYAGTLRFAEGQALLDTLCGPSHRQ